MIDYLVTHPEAFVAFWLVVTAFAMWVMHQALKNLNDRLNDVFDVFFDGPFDQDQ